MPDFTHSLLQPITKLNGIGEKSASSLKKLLGQTRIIDLLYLVPSYWLTRKKISHIREAQPGDLIITCVQIKKHLPAYGNKTPYKIQVQQEDSLFEIVFFHRQQSWIKSNFPINSQKIISGKVSFFHHQPLIIHPDYVVSPEQAKNIPEIEAIYPTTAPLRQKFLQKTIQQALKLLPSNFPEWLDRKTVEERGWPTHSQALKQLHAPQENILDLENCVARRRLAYDELLAYQFMLNNLRQNSTKILTAPLPPKHHLTCRLRKALPFQLTQDQEQAISEIEKDLASSSVMSRLLQGDVGSGKTIVALFAMLQIVENGGQAALMAPTEMLAQQHYSNIKALLAPLNVKAVFIRSQQSAKERAAFTESLKNGEASLVIGTHALLYENIQFKQLSLAIIDEQHRFGVEQRMQLRSKGQAVHLLVMTATPIPRTLLLCHFGDLDVSQIKQKPLGRKEIKTVTFSAKKIQELIKKIHGALAEGEKIYWICPLIEDSETISAANATQRFEMLQKHFGTKVFLLHGQMKPAEKEAQMQCFKAEKSALLVATTVIEVGIDVPEATIIIIENAERFGLSQLHQLRGRVGRSHKASFCVLMYDEPLSATARARLNVLRHSNDGFIIAEEDLRLRGSGNVLGKEQTGMPQFKFANLAYDSDLLLQAYKEARYLATMHTERTQALKLLLSFFYDEKKQQFFYSS